MALENRDLQADPVESGPKAANDNQENNYDKAKLTQKELRQLEKDPTTISKIVAKRDQLAQVAEAKLNKYITDSETPVLTESQYIEYQKQIRDIDSADLMEEKLEEIDKIPEQARQNALDEAKNSVELDPEDTKLKTLQKDFDTICDDNIHLIGANQIKGFKKWFEQQRNEKPTVKHLTEQIKRLKGEGINDKNGLAPRRTEFGKLTVLYEKYGLDPLKTDYIRKEGLSERSHFREQAEALEDFFGKMKKLGFYSPKMIKGKMQEMLEANNPVAQIKILSKAVEIGRKESTGFTRLDSTVTIEGVTIRKMSEASKKEYLKYYRDSDFREREDMVDNWEKLVDNEAELSEKLVGIYGDDKEGLKIAVKSFGKLTFQEKTAALKKHQEMVDKAQDKESLHKALLQDSVKVHAKDAVNKKIFNAKTAQNHIDWFEKDENHKNEKTKKQGDYKALKKSHDIFTNKVPDTKNHNIAAYEKHREHFKEHLKELADLNPDMNKSFLKKRQNDFDAQGWKGRKVMHDKLEEDIEEQEKQATKNKTIEHELNITAADKIKSKERSAAMKDIIIVMADLEAEGTAEAANKGYKALHLYKVANFDEASKDKVFLNLESKFSRLRLTLGLKQEAANDDREKKIEAAVATKAKAENNKVALEANAIQQINVDQTRKDEDRNNRADTMTRAEKVSMGTVQDGSTEAELTKDFYDQQRLKDQSADTFILKDGTGEQVAETKFDDTTDIRTDVEADKKKIREHTSDISQNKGFRHVELKDQKGQVIKAETAAKYQEQQNIELKTNLADEGIETVRLRDRVLNPFKSPAAEADKAIAMRAAEKARQEAQATVRKAA